MPEVELSKISKRFGATEALRGITLEIGEGEAVVFMGPNGAGKTTLLRIISGQVEPTSGTARVRGLDAVREKRKVKGLVGLVGHGSFLYDELTVEENLRFYGRFKGSGDEELGRVIGLTGLERWRGERAAHLSYGLRKRADIARALLGSPPVLVLDELFSGLDQEACKTLVRNVGDRRGKTLILSSHSLEWAREICDRGVFLRDGSVERDVSL